MEVATDSVTIWNINLKLLQNSRKVDCGLVLHKLEAAGWLFH